MVAKREHKWAVALLWLVAQGCAATHTIDEPQDTSGTFKARSVDVPDASVSSARPILDAAPHSDASTELPRPDASERRREGAHWKDVAVGWSHTCAIGLDGTLWCWGAATHFGQLEYGGSAFMDIDTPMQMGEDDDWVEVDTNGLLSCGLRGNAGLYCWGDSSSHPSGKSHSTPALVLREQGLSGLNMEYRSACVLDKEGQKLCWSAGTPPLATHPDIRWTLSVGGEACGIDTGGHLWCSEGYALGNDILLSDEEFSLRPVGTHGDWFDASATGHVCAIRSEGRLYCAGLTSHGTLGEQTELLEGTYFTRVGAESDWFRVGVAPGLTCALRADGELWCWGRNHKGQTGIGPFKEHSTGMHPVQPERRFKELSVGQLHGCAIAQDDTLWCWGNNSSGVLGLGFTSKAELPSQVIR